jgi:hypothetical protein
LGLLWNWGVKLFELYGEYKRIENSKWRVVMPIKYHYKSDSHIVPRGFQSDLASIPSWAHWAIGPSEEGLARPSILHDYYYRIPNQYTRKYADNLMYDAMMELGYSTIKANIVYYSVRLFGWLHYHG